MRCDQCNWIYENQCVCEDEETHFSSTQYTNDCIGFLDKDFEQQLWNTYSECVELLTKRKLNELLDIKSFILSQRS
jgi:hypothetical protein